MTTEAEPSPPDERVAGINRIRDATRWLILAFAAIGAAIAGTAPLSNIGKLGIHDWRLWVAAGSAAAAFAAIAAAIWVTANVLTPLTTSLDGLVADPELRAKFGESFEYLEGHGTNLDEFRTQYEKARADYVEALVEQSKHPSPQADGAVEEARQQFFAFSSPLERITTEGALARMRRKFRSARAVMFAGGFAAGLAIIAFAWAANPPDPGTKAVAAKPVAAAFDVAARGPGVQISPVTARRLLRAHGISRSTALSYVASFRGPIEVQTVQKNAVFARYAATAATRGRFLTSERFAGPRLARLALHLPWENTAACLQRVSAKRRTLVLKGEIAQGKSGVIQLLMPDQDAFTFSKGRAYTKIPCPS